MGFSLADMLSEVSGLDTNREQLEYIKLDLIDADPNNFYQLSGVEDLAANIQLCGLQQPIRLRKHPTEAGRYMIVSGHRRREAILLLAKDDPDKWEEVPCIIEADEVPAALQQLRLIYANSNTRTMTSAELSEQAVQVEKLLYQLKEEGYEFPGRMRDHVAKAVNASKTKLARLKVIRDNLAKCWEPYYKKDVLSESTAYELAKMSVENQKLLFDAKKKNGRDIKYLYAGDIEVYAKRFEAIEKISCKKHGKGAECQNKENKKAKASAVERYYNCNCGRCCGTCPDLASCKYACPCFADKIKKIKADKREASRQAKLDQEERDRPYVERLQSLWLRFGLAREQAGKSIKETCKAADLYYHPGTEKRIEELENCTANITRNTEAPYGYSYDIGAYNKLGAMADLFGCSVDYLLCRTDIREMAQTTSEVSKPGTIWHPVSEEPPIGVDLVWVDNAGYSDTGEYYGSERIESNCTIQWPEARYWAYLPKEEA